MSELELVVYGLAQPAGSKNIGRTKAGRSFIYDSADKGDRRGKQWRERVAQEAGQAMNGRPLLAGALLIRARFYMPRPKGHYGTGRNADRLKPSAPMYPTTKPDATKLFRGVEDALRGVVFRDDGQVVEQHVSKRYGEPARAEISVVKVEG